MIGVTKCHLFVFYLCIIKCEPLTDNIALAEKEINMKKLLYGFLAIDIIIFAFLAMNGGLSAPKYDLKPMAYQEILNQGTGTFVDIRTPQEHEDAFIPNSTLIDWKSSSFVEEIQKVDKDKPVFIYCRTGMRAARAKRKMKKMGFKEVYNLRGGIKAWAKEGLPVKSRPGFDINAEAGGEGC